MKFNQDFIERVQDANNLVDIISQYTQLKPAAGGFMGRCPFPDHPEKTPSFSVSETKQVYNCFGCHKKGNVFTFLQEMRGMNFRESIEWLAERARIPLPEISGTENEKLDLIAQKKKDILKVNKLAAQYFHEQFRLLPANHPAVQYAFKKRGLSKETITEFQIGYATEEWDGLVRFLESKSVAMSLAEEARLVKPRKEGRSGHYDFFRDRLMFPVLNVVNEVVAFGGRVILQGEPKYLNSQETPAFHKAKVLYGLSSTARYIRSEDAALVVEGYMDLVSLFQAGINNSVASMGTALTADHGKLLSRMTKNIVVLFDGDEAGIGAAERSLPILLASGLHPKGLILPDGQDPDDFVRARGAEALRQLIQQSSDLYSMILSLWLQDFRGEASQKIKMADKLKPVFAAIQDPRLVQLYLKETAPLLQVDVGWLMEAVRPGVSKIQDVQRPVRDTQVFAPARSSSVVPSASAAKPVAKAENTVVEGKISLRGVSNSERALIYLVLKNRTHMETVLASGLLEDDSAMVMGAGAVSSREFESVNFHSGAKTVLEKAASVYRQSPEKFDKLIGLLTSLVDAPELLFAQSNLQASEPVAEMSSEVDSMALQEALQREAQLLQDSIRRVKENSLKLRAEALAKEIKTSPTAEKLEEYAQLIRSRKMLKASPAGDGANEAEN